MDNVQATKGQKFEVRFKPTDKGGVMAAVRVNGRISFPDRKGPQPKDGDIWEVEIAGENPAGSVYFLKCLRFVSNPEMRRAQEQKERDERDAQAKRDREHIQSELETLRPAIEALVPLPYQEKIELPGFAGYKVMGSSTTAEIITKDPQAGIEAKITQEVFIFWGTDHINANYTVNRSGWDVAKLSNYSRKPDKDSQTMSVCFSYCGKEVKLVYPAKVTITFRENGKKGEIRQDTIKQIITALTPLGEVTEEEIVWQEPQSWTPHEPWDQTAVDQLVAEIRAEISQIEKTAEAEKSAGLLVINPVNGWYALRDKYQMPGISIAKWSKQDYGMVIDPALASIFDDQFKFTPLEMKSANQIPDGINPWAEIEWPHGRQVDPEKVKAFMADTQTEAVLLTEAEFKTWCETNSTELEIEMIDSVDVTSSGDPTFRYHVRFLLPYKIVEFHDMDGYKIIRSTRIELRETEIAVAGWGNRPFTGKLQGKLLRNYSSRSEERIGGVYYVSFEIPPTDDEIAAAENKAWENFIADCKRNQAVLSGWRYSYTGNPIVYLRVEQIGSPVYWTHREFVPDEANPHFEWRKGFGSKKAQVSRIDRQTINVAMQEYLDHGWEVEEDKSLPVGQSVLKYLGFEEEE